MVEIAEARHAVAARGGPDYDPDDDSEGTCSDNLSDEPDLSDVLTVNSSEDECISVSSGSD
eukprot:5805301-Karenia_brevis.AAC.1